MSTRIRTGRSWGAPGSRYERRTRARARRIQKRLDQVQQERVARTRRSKRRRDPRRGRAYVRARQTLLFGTSLLLGSALTPLLAEEAVGRWSGQAPTLSAISVLGNRRLPAREVALATGLSKAETLDGLQPDDIEERLARHPWIRAARVVLLPTGTLIVDIEEREARAVVRGTDTETGLFLDAHCVPFAPVEAARLPTDPPLPALRSPTPREIGRADRELCRALSLAESVRNFARPDASPTRNRYARSEVLLPTPDSELGWLLREPSGSSVILGDGPPAQLSGRLARLERLLDSGIDALERASTIDLRFADQAVLRGVATREGLPKRGG